jgi:hypothetical protein
MPPGFKLLLAFSAAVCLAAALSALALDGLDLPRHLVIDDSLGSAAAVAVATVITSFA